MFRIWERWEAGIFETKRSDSETLDLLGKLEIKGADAAQIVGGEVDGYLIINVTPFRVMIHRLGSEGNSRHQSECLDEGRELESLVELALFDAPAG